MELETRLETAGLQLIRRDIGTGGSADVHQCQVIRTSDTLPDVGTVVAVKEYRTALLSVPGQFDRVKQEASLGQGFDHPNIVKTYQLLLYEGEDGVPGAALILEWINGETLEQWYRRRPKPIVWEEVRSIALDVVAALEMLHAQSVMHRDVKPENVMVRDDGRAVLMDIGVAELTGDNDFTMHTSVAQFVGSARYAAPQFIMGEPFVAADDIYSLGATLFLLFTGHQIFSEIERKPVLPIAVVSGNVKIDALQDNIPASMQVVLAGTLHRERKRRPSLAQLRECLENPETAPYITKEIEHQAAEVRTYVIMSVMDKGSQFLADLAGDTPEIDDVYEVIRTSQKISVPSYGREVTPEIWVASATLKHVNSNVGHFIVTKRRWQDGKPSPIMSHSVYGTPGQWVYDDAIKPVVAKGDLVLRKKNE